MANNKQKLNNVQRKTQNISHNMCEMLRDKAKLMGHKAAKFSDETWNRYADALDKRFTLREAKLYIENYIMGNLEPAEFAQVMAEDDKLRYTISDLCRLRLEPVTPNIQRNNSYIDIGAGVKTFWTEIRVPLPSEIDAARDIRNINFGIEAGRATAGTKQMSDSKRSFKDILNDAKKLAAEKLASTADDKKDSHADVKFDESWLETDDGKEYKSEYTRNAAQRIENIAMNIEAGKDKKLDPKEREKALESAGVVKEQAEKMAATTFETEPKGNDMLSGYSNEDLSQPLNVEMHELFEQILQHIDKDYNSLKDDKQNDDNVKSGYVKAQFDGKTVVFKDNWSGHKFTEEEINKLLAGEEISFTYTDKKNEERTVSGVFDWQEFNGHKFFGFAADIDKPKSLSSDDTADIDKPKPLSDTELSDEELMNYSMGGEQISEQDDISMEDYYSQLANDMMNEDICEFSDEDCAILSSDNIMQLGG